MRLPGQKPCDLPAKLMRFAGQKPCEYAFNSRCPIILNGIDAVGNRSDLIDRALVISLPKIKDDKRISEQEYWKRFEEIAPIVLGGILDATAAVLKNLPDVELDQVPRMADFARVVTAAEPALKWKTGSFLKAYRANRSEALRMGLEASLIAEPLLTLLEANGYLSGTASELLKMLNECADGREHKPSWPQSPKALSTHIMRISPILEDLGWSIDHTRDSAKRTIHISSS